MSSKNKHSTLEEQYKRLEKSALEHEKLLREAGYAGGPSSVDGSATFRGGPYGFGGVDQLATGLAEPVKKLKKRRDKEAVYNIASQQRINRGYPAPQSVSGFPGGESSSGIRSGERIPNDINDIALSTAELEAVLDRPEDKEYFGFDEEDLSPVPLDDEEDEDLKAEAPERDLKEFGSSGAQGAMRGVPSDKNYRDLPGWPRPNTIEKPGNFVPEVEGDEDGDGEEDDYLADEEYVNDVLRLNGIGIKPGHLKKLFGRDSIEELEESKLYERTLYHGTIIDHKDSIEKYGLTGDLGDFVKDSYGMELDEEEWEERLGGVTFAAQKDEMDKATGAIRYHIGKKIGKWITEVTVDDIRRWGMLAVIKDVDEGDDYGDEWKRRPENWEDESRYEEYPMSVEPGDWYTQAESAYVDQILTGQKLVDFLRRHGALEHVSEEDEKREMTELIKLAVAYHGPKYRDDIVNKVKQLSPKAIEKQLKKYREFEEAQETIAQRRAQRYGGAAQKQRGKQLSFDFGEGTLSLKSVFFEAENYVSPADWPEPDRPTERYKQGYWEETPQGDDWLINPVDYSKGHVGDAAAEHSPGGQSYGQIGAPKDFVPDDWEQRHPKTKEEPMDPEELEEVIQAMVMEIFEEAYTGLDDETGRGEPKGGSEAFRKNRKKIFDYDEDQKPGGIEDLKNYHMDE